MSLLDLHGDDMLSAAQAEPPTAPRRQEPKFSAWGLAKAAPRGGVAGVAEAAGSVADVSTAVGRNVPSASANLGPLGSVPFLVGIQSVMQTGMQMLKPKEGQFTSEVGTSLRNVAKDYMPDPLTAHASEMVVADFSRVATKAVTAGVALGPAGGAVAAGAEEGFTASDKLAREGVDVATRTKVGAVTAAVTAAGFALPVAGQTVKQTVGLALAGGPVSFVAQQAATREILQEADYSELADQYDPFDPVGLTLSTLVPLGFGAASMRSSARASAKADKALVEAARVNLLREQVEAAKPADTMEADAPHQAAYSKALDQMANGEPVDVLDVAQRDLTPAVREFADQVDAELLKPTAPKDYAADEFVLAMPEQAQARTVEMYTRAAEVKPKFDAEMSSIADELGITVKLAEIKGTERATAKIMSDYGGDASKIKDLVRATLISDSASGAQRAAAALFERFEVLPRGRNLLDPGVQPPDGYRDAKFNVVVEGVVTEVQINIPEMLAAKKKAHPLYAEREALRRQYEGKVFPDVARSKYEDLNAQMRGIYEPAWARALARDSSTSLANTSLRSGPNSGAPLRDAESDGNTRGGSVSQAIENGTPGASGNRETGMPSTSSSSALGPKTGSSIDTSEASILALDALDSLGVPREASQPLIDAVSQAMEPAKPAAQAPDFLTREVDSLLTNQPDMLVQLEGMDAPSPISEVMAMVRQEAAQDLEEAPLVQAAAECAIRNL